MKCKCGNNEFFAHQKVYTDIIVDEDGNFKYNSTKSDEVKIYECEIPIIS